MTTRIELFENGIHSLAEALRAFKRFHDDSTDRFALKDAILRSYHGLETLFKYLLLIGTLPPDGSALAALRKDELSPGALMIALMRRDELIRHGRWALLLPDDVKVKEIVGMAQALANNEVLTPLESERTIGCVEAIKRLRSLHELDELDMSEFEQLNNSVDELRRYRNALEHFGLEADAEVVGRILGNAVPRSWDVFTARIPEVRSRVQEVYSDASEIVELLRSEYDELIQSAISCFKGKSFPNQQLTLRVRDHGQVGPPPYWPEVAIDGMLQAHWDYNACFAPGIGGPSELMARSGVPVRQYTGAVRVAKPELLDDTGSPGSVYKRVRGHLELTVALDYPTAEELVNLPEVREKAKYLRQVSVNVAASLVYEAEAIYDMGHYGVNRVIKADGKLDIRLTAMSKGYAGSKQPELVGRYSASLDQHNSPFRLHSFVEPNGELKEGPRMLDWNIETSADFSFL